MKFVIQRASQASVSIDGAVYSQIEKGFFVLVGICDEDTGQTADKMVKKLVGLRIFEDSDGKTNLSLNDVNGQPLLVSQFTLYADCRKGNRPSFVKAGKPEHARQLFEYVAEKCRETVKTVRTGVFGADMQISLINDGPFTVILDSDQL